MLSLRIFCPYLFSKYTRAASHNSQKAYFDGGGFRSPHYSEHTHPSAKTRKLILCDSQFVLTISKGLMLQQRELSRSLPFIQRIQYLYQICCRRREILRIILLIINISESAFNTNEIFQKKQIRHGCAVWKRHA